MTSWDQYRAYWCDCGDECINHLDLDRTDSRECKACYQVDSLEDADPANPPAGTSPADAVAPESRCRKQANRRDGKLSGPEGPKGKGPVREASGEGSGTPESLLRN